MMFSQSLTSGQRLARTVLPILESPRGGEICRYQEIEARSLDMGEHRTGNGGEHSRQRRDVELDAEDVVAGDAGNGGDQGGGERQPKLGAPQPSRCGLVSASALLIELDLSVGSTLDILQWRELGSRH
jgi:hypothetical protein